MKHLAAHLGSLVPCSSLRKLAATCRSFRKLIFIFRSGLKSTGSKTYKILFLAYYMTENKFCSIRCAIHACNADSLYEKSVGGFYGFERIAEVRAVLLINFIKWINKWYNFGGKFSDFLGFSPREFFLKIWTLKNWSCKVAS